MSLLFSSHLSSLLRATPIYTLQFFTLLFLCIRLTFNLKLFRPLRHFLYIFQQIFVGIVPFGIVLGFGTATFILTGVIGDANYDFRGSALDVVNGIFYGEVATD
jgi:hypothetical protein